MAPTLWRIEADLWSIYNIGVIVSGTPEATAAAGERGVEALSRRDRGLRRFILCGFGCGSHTMVSRKLVAHFGSPYNKDRSIQGSVGGSFVYGNPPIS